MARPLRIEFSGAIYHVTSRGNERRAIFRDDHDRETFLAILGAVVRRFGLTLFEYCLMGNHYHLFVKTPEANLSRAMHRLNQLYAEYFNRRHQRVGHLFQGRFHGALIDSETYFKRVSRYVVLNPVRAGMRKTPGGYRWSSYRAMAGLAEAPEWLAVDELLAEFDSWDREAARSSYREWVAGGLDDTNLWDDLEGQFVLGTEAYVARIRAMIDERKTKDPEYPKAQRFLGRPSLESVITAVARHCETSEDSIRTGHGGLARMLVAELATEEALAKLRPTAKALGLTSGSRISKLARRCREEIATTPDLRALRARIMEDLYPGEPVVNLPPSESPPAAAPF